jgi:hypothetical protein
MADNGTHFDVYSGLLDPKHRKKIGAAIWTYLWLLDRQTAADGWVLGGKPIKAKEIGDTLGLHETKIRSHLHQLEEGHYLTSERTPYGFRLRVLRAKKFTQKRITENGNSGGGELPKTVTPDRPKTVTLSSENGNSGITENGNSNKDTTVIQPSRHQEYTPAFEEFWQMYPKKLGKRDAFKCWKTRLKEGVQAEVLTTACRHYRQKVVADGTEERFMMHGSTFLGPGRRYEDFIEPPNLGGNNGRRPRSQADELAEAMRRLEAEEGVA